MLARTLTLLAILQAPEPSTSPPAWDSEPLGDPSDDPVGPPPEPRAMSGRRLLAGGAVACGIGSAALAVEIEFLVVGRMPWLQPIGHIGVPICLHTVVPGAALRGRADGRRDRLAGTRQDTTPMRRAGLGLTIAGPLITGLAVGSAWLIPSENSRFRTGAGMPLNAMGASGFAAFATGLSLIARARNYDAQFGGSAGVWAPRGAGTLTSAAVLGLGSLAMPLVAARTEWRLIGSAGPLVRLTFASTLLGAVGGHLYGQWQREHADGPRKRKRAGYAYAAGVTLVTLAPAFGIAFGIAGDQARSPCPAPPDENENSQALFPPPPPLTKCDRDFRTKLAVPAMLGIASLEIGAALLGYATAWAPDDRRIIRDQTVNPWISAAGFGLTWAGRF